MNVPNLLQLFVVFVSTNLAHKIIVTNKYELSGLIINYFGFEFELSWLSQLARSSTVTMGATETIN